MIQTIRACDDDWYRPREQGDAAECLQYILDSLHDAVHRRVRIGIQGTAASHEEQSQIKALESWSSFFSKEYSPIVENFYGQSQIKIRCNQCDNVSERYEPWMMMKVPIPGGDVGGGEVPSFSVCMDAAHKPEEIEAYDCDICKKRGPATMTTRISKLPNTLILVFKRFNNHGQKVRAEIDWGIDGMSLAPWLAFRRCPFTDRLARSNYRTFAVIEHSGSTRGGHYRMFSRQGAAAAPWIEYDDDAIRTISDSRQIVSPDSYVILASPN
jgi:ubiquitin C-terminal hydrolase